MDNAIIKYNYSKATINGTPNSGGLIGLSERYAIITDNFAVGSVLNTGQKINGFIGHDQFSTTINNNYWDTYLTGQSTCYYWGTCTPGCYDTNSGCVATSNAASSYYGLTGIPFSALNFDGNWVAQTNDYPKLYWED